MIDWQKGTWAPGDRVKFHGGRTPIFLDVTPGLYWYSGLGSGTFFRNDGTMLLNCSPQEAHSEARQYGLEMHYVDSFECYRSISVGG